MKALDKYVGEEIAPKLRAIAQRFAICGKELVKVRDLLDELNGVVGRQVIAMMRSTARNLCGYLNTSMDELTIDQAFENKRQFRSYLRARRYTKASVHSYRGYLSRLLRYAMEAGWHPQKPDLPPEWSGLANRVVGSTESRELVQYLIARGKVPSSLTEIDLHEWASLAVGNGLTCAQARRAIAIFRDRLRHTGLLDYFPHIHRFGKKPTKYSISLQQMNASLRQEIQGLLRWKQAAFVSGRPKEARVRPVTAKRLTSRLCMLYGFTTTVLGQQDVTTVLDMFNADVVGRYADWLLNERRNASSSVAHTVRSVLGAIRQYPPYAGEDFAWIEDLLSTIPDDPETRVIARKEAKWVPHDELVALPAKIRNWVNPRHDPNSVSASRAAHDALLMDWLVTLPWRQTNVKDCRIGSQSSDANLFKGPLPLSLPMAKPDWLEQELAKNPAATFWQFRFSEQETKARHAVRGIVPRRLVHWLEEYVRSHRANLVSGTQTQTLFVNSDGGPLSSTEIYDLITTLTLRFTGKIVNPHLFRDIFAYKWLDDHPYDYLTIQKALWHTTVDMTLRTYGRKFDESHAAMRVDEWFNKRGL